MNNMIIAFASSIFTITCSATGYALQTDAQLITPRQAGFAPGIANNQHGEVRYYASTEGKPLDTTRRLPLVLFLDGSGPTPLYWNQDGQIGCSLMFDAREFPGYHFVVISKPGINFCEPNPRVQSAIYDKLASLRWRIDAAHAVINKLAVENFVDTSRLLVIGHSEGSDVAPWVALNNRRVTHVAGLAAGGQYLMHDLIVTCRKEIASGKLSPTAGAAQILDIKQAFRDIFADPESTTKKWSGETYLRWSTFFQPSIEAWSQIQKPVYLGVCQFDQNTPVESGEAIELEFIRLGKQNLTFKVWPCDHYFFQPAQDQEAPPTERRLDALREILEWTTHHPNF